MLEKDRISVQSEHPRNPSNHVSQLPSICSSVDCHRPSGVSGDSANCLTANRHEALGT
jgi:capsule polysaccharide modification protein KpsS